MTQFVGKVSLEYIDSKQAKNILGKIQIKIDDFQLKRRYLSFIYSVYKKYGQDKGGYQSALIAYYGFLSFFPLLVAILSVAQLSILRSQNLRSDVLKALNTYLPIVGKQLQNQVHTKQGASLALGISLLLTIYGSRGVANSIQSAMNHIWQVPMALRAGFPKDAIRSIEIIFIGGFGFIVSGILSSYAAGLHDPTYMRLLTFLGSLIVIFVSLMIVFKLSVSTMHSYKDFLYGSIVAAIGLQIVQLLAGFLITHELRHFNSLYGSLGLVFVVLFWIYLQARILLYASEFDTVRVLKLWPRSFTGFRLTEADKLALTQYVRREIYIDPKKEDVGIRISTEKNNRRS